MMQTQSSVFIKEIKMHDKNALNTPKCTLSNAMITTKSHRHIDANSPMLGQGIIPNAN